MSNLTAILLMQATFGLMMLCLVLLFVIAHRRMDEIVTGIVNGVPISKKYRSLLPFYDYLGYVALGMILLITFATGFHEVADVAADPSVGTLANFCAVVCAVIAVGIIVLSTVMFFHMLSVVRQAKGG
jgi:hypothetical protein